MAKTTRKTSSSTPAKSEMPKTVKRTKAAAAKPRTSRVPAPPEAKALEAKAAEAKLQGPELKKRELLQKVVTKSGIKKKDAKPVVEAMLDVLGEALADGRELNLQPLGKLKLNRTKETTTARIIVAKIRQSKGKAKDASDAPPPIAAAAE